MTGRRSTIVVEDFYSDPNRVRNWALQQQFYAPYDDRAAPFIDIDEPLKATWVTTWYRDVAQCPFKQSADLIDTLEHIVGERIDLSHWQRHYPIDEGSRSPRGLTTKEACLWNCSVHVKFDFGQKLGDGVHNHVSDNWNSVGPDGWAGLIYLNPNAPLEGGLHLWENVDRRHQFDWMTPAKNWRSVDRFANLYNRLLLVRGNIPHSGSNGWGRTISTGRMFQTLFFKTSTTHSYSVKAIG
jgi:hypothetical protein